MNTIKARSTYYAGVLMKSRLEARFASWLDRAGRRWRYEPFRIILPNGFEWVPDFELDTPNRHDGAASWCPGTLVEVKSYAWDFDRSYAINLGSCSHHVAAADAFIASPMDDTIGSPWGAIRVTAWQPSPILESLDGTKQRRLAEIVR